MSKIRLNRSYFLFGNISLFISPFIINSNFISSLLTQIIYSFVVPPNIVPFAFGSDTIEAGEMAQLQCIVSLGDAPIQITWSFHGKDSSTTKQTGVSTMKLGGRSSVLIIDSVSSLNVGTYTFCKECCRKHIIFYRISC